jgi:hypothetical protein
LSFSKELIKGGEEFYSVMDDCLDIIRKTLKQIKDSDIEIFLHFNPEVAV